MKFEDIKEGLAIQESYQITQAIFDGFIEAFQDLNPLHIDAGYAQQNGFRGQVMHGAILQGFLSHFIGMRFPGRASFLLSVDMRYLKPSYLNDKIEIHVDVKQKAESRRLLVLDFKFFNATQDTDVARGRAQVMVRDEK